VVEADFDRSIQGEQLWVAEIGKPVPKSDQIQWQVAGLISVFLPAQFVHSLFVTLPSMGWPRQRAAGSGALCGRGTRLSEMRRAQSEGLHIL